MEMNFPDILWHFLLLVLKTEGHVESIKWPPALINTCQY